MKILLVLLVLLAIAGVLAFLFKKGPKRLETDQGVWPFYVKAPLSQPEQILYHRLVRVLPDHIVLAQVQVSRVLGVKKGANFKEWNNRINRLSYDFVVCSKDSTPLAAIELDDKTHDQAARQEADQRKDKATTDAGLRMIRWNVRALPSEEAIRQEIFPAKAAAVSSSQDSTGIRSS